MKVRIFNRGKGWYISCVNWKDKEDKAYINVHFAHKDDPIPNNVNMQNSGYDFTDIDVLEAKFECYEKKPSMTVFKYEPFLNAELKQNPVRNFNQNTLYTSDVPTAIDEEDVPW